jgi:hypothetical protein
MDRLILRVVATAVVAAALFLCATAPAAAAVIATDDFESYTLGDIIGQGTIASGWESAYSGLASARPASIPLREVTSGVMPGFGQSLALGHSALGDRANNDNIVQRLFTPQTGTVYFGFAFKTTGFDLEGATSFFKGDFFQLYVNNTSNETGTAGSQGDSLSCGEDVNPAPDPGEPNGVFASKGGYKTGLSTGPTNDAVHRMVMRISMSSPEFPGIYDQVAMFFDQATEGTPDGARGVGEPTDPGFNTVSVLHLRIWGMELEDRVYIDSIRIATTYAEALPDLPVVPTIPGDTDGNSIVNEVDAAVVASHWGATELTGGFSVGDFNADGAVNAADASIQAANWGSHTGEGAAGVPEPGAVAVLAAMALAALVRRSR